MRLLAFLLILLSAPGCRGARLRHLERDVERMSARVTILESRVAGLEQRTTPRLVPTREGEGAR